MSKDEFFAFMPLLIYGLAIGELILHWKDYLTSKRRYWPHLITGLLLLELAFVNFYYLYDDLENLFETYPKFLLKMIVPIIFLLTVSAYTPDDNVKVEDYFKGKMHIVFSLLGIYILAHILNDFDLSFINLMRLISALVCFVIAYFKRFQLIWLLIILRLLFFFFFDNSFNPQ